MANEPPPPERHTLSEHENRQVFETQILPDRLARLRPVPHPSVHFFGAQPGAGKSTVQNAVRRALSEQDGLSSAALIIGDDFRPYHPRYFSLMEKGDELAAFYTDRDSARWVERAIEYTARLKPHVILEGTLRDPQVTLDTAKRYRPEGFHQGRVMGTGNSTGSR